MSEISTYKLIKEKLQAIPNNALKGSWFEKVSKRFLKEHDRLMNTSLLIFGAIGN
ncbi:hypothetical protein [Helicobacter pylori]|uniref:hypothetical protein n=1 Tax=Helicobacter pylori TaxID=210 RepID=UPI003CC87E25